MEQLVKDVMASNPICLEVDANIERAAAQMREHDIGSVLVVDGGEVVGIVTDRDIVVRAVADGRDPDETLLGELASRSAYTINPEEPLEQAVQDMRDNGVRRLPVCDQDGMPVGVVSIGDLAEHRDPNSALADISAEHPNH